MGLHGLRTSCPHEAIEFSLHQDGSFAAGHFKYVVVSHPSATLESKTGKDHAFHSRTRPIRPHGYPPSASLPPSEAKNPVSIKRDHLQHISSVLWNNILSNSGQKRVIPSTAGPGQSGHTAILLPQACHLLRLKIQSPSRGITCSTFRVCCGITS